LVYLEYDDGRGDPSFPDGPPLPIFSSFQPVFQRGALARAPASWLSGPAMADGFLSPSFTPTDPHGSVGPTKKPASGLPGAGLSVSGSFLLHPTDPRALRLFDGSIPGLRRDWI